MKREDLTKAAQERIEQMLEMNRVQQEVLDRAAKPVEKLMKGETLNRRDRTVLIAEVGLNEDDVAWLHENDYDDDLKARHKRLMATPYSHCYEKVGGKLVRVDVHGDKVSLVSEDDEDFG